MTEPRRPGPVHGLWVAAGFLTRVPVGDVGRDGAVVVDVARAVPWFPLVGLVIGAVQGAIFYGAHEVTSPLVAAVLALATSLLITGAFHHDGLADVADAFGGGWTVEERMVILKDSRLGTYGVSALGVALLLEVAALSQLSPIDGLRALLVAQSLGRASALVTMLVAPMAGSGMGASYIARVSTPATTVGVAFAVGVAVLMSPAFWPATVAGAAIASAAVVALAVRKINGVNGDVLGAVTVVSSLAILVISGSL